MAMLMDISGVGIYRDCACTEAAKKRQKIRETNTFIGAVLIEV